MFRCYLEGVARRPIDTALLAAFLDAVPAMVDQLLEAGLALRLTGLSDYYLSVPGATVGHVIAAQPFDPETLGDVASRVRQSPYRDCTPPWTGGMALMASLVAACTAAGARIWTSSQAIRLRTKDRAVVGVDVHRAGAPALVRADQVILAIGGFEFNSALVREWIGEALEGAWSCPGNEGDGLLMAQSVGAALSAVGEVQWYALLRLSDEVREGAPLFADAGPARNLPGSIIIDGQGRRFANESGQYQDFGRALGGRVSNRRPAWLVVDQAFLDAYGQACFGDRPLAPPHWLTAPTAAELAVLAGVHPGVFEPIRGG